MCGIIGFISRKNINPERWETAKNHLLHRGPDFQGEKIFQLNDCTIGLAHQRLSIIDLSNASNQPIVDENYAIIFNGEIYNYKELIQTHLSKSELLSQSDTLTLFEMLKLFGAEKTAEECDGMWAWAFLDKKESKIILSRDRFGEKPLYWTKNENGFYFSSEIKALIEMTGDKYALNDAEIKLYLDQSLLNTSQNTLFKNIYSLMPGSILTVNFNHDISYSEKSYWDITDKPKYNYSTFDDFCKKFYQLFEESISRRLRADVDIGILLSGGLDSTAILGMSNKISKSSLDKYSLLSSVSEDKRYDESKFIDIASEYYKKDVKKVFLPEDPKTLFSHVEKLTWYADTPLGSLSNVSHYLLMEKAKELGITVILSGQGADELFCGYKKYLGFYILNLIRHHKFLKAITTLFDFLKNGTVLFQFNFAEAKRYLPKLLKNNKDKSYLSEKLQFLPTIPMGLKKNQSLQERQMEDFLLFSVPFLNHFEDRMSMACSREIRLPFLYHKLVQHVIHAPIEYKLNFGWTKYALRKAMENDIPKEISWRKDKQGFVNPQSELLKNELQYEILNNYFKSDALIFKYEIIDREKLLDIYATYRAQKPSKGTIWFRDIFNPIALEIWLRVYSNYIKSEK